jgi:hypothetical protein
MAGLSVGDQNPSPLAEPVSMSAAKKAKANFEKVAKKKPDPEGLSVAEQAQTALTGKDFATAKDLFEKAQAVCEGSEAKAVKVPKVGLGNQGTPGARVARLSLMTVHRAARTSAREQTERQLSNPVIAGKGRESFCGAPVHLRVSGG